MDKTEPEIVRDFAQKMLEKIELRHNRYVPFAWANMDVKRLLFLLKGEVAELEQAYYKTDTGNALEDAYSHIQCLTEIQDEALDIANYALFIYEMSHGKK